MASQDTQQNTQPLQPAPVPNAPAPSAPDTTTNSNGIPSYATTPERMGYIKGILTTEGATAALNNGKDVYTMKNGQIQFNGQPISTGSGTGTQTIPGDVGKQYETNPPPSVPGFQEALQKLQNSGQQPPQTQGAASAAVQQAMPPAQPAPYDGTKTDALMADNQAHQQYMTDFAASQSSQAQTDTLTQEYTKMTQAAGVPALNTQLINMKAVMDGTENDIRNEISKAGGFATESQVLGLTNARNKTMIQNYNNLLQTRNDALANVNTMIGLSEKDRAYAKQKIDDQLNFDQQQIQFADKALTNAQDSLKNTAASEGWDNVYKAAVATGDAGAIARINSMMGPGFDLQTAAQQDAQTRAAQAQQAQLATTEKETTIAKNIADVNKINADSQIAQANAAAQPAKDAAALAETQARTDQAIATTQKTLVDAQIAAANAQTQPEKDAAALKLQQADINLKNAQTSKTNADARLANSKVGANATHYDVNPGDTFTTIAAKLGTTAEAMQAANPNVEATNLQIGQTLNLPPKGQLGKAGTTPGSLSKTELTQGTTALLNNGGTQSDVDKFKTDRGFQAWVLKKYGIK